jgi:hypothetical protein
MQHQQLPVWYALCSAAGADGDEVLHFASDLLNVGFVLIESGDERAHLRRLL